MISRPRFVYLNAKLFFSIVWARLWKQRRPLNVYICVTNYCNLRCKYCYGMYYKRDRWREFTTEELLDLIDTLHRQGTRYVQFQGGEPLLRKDLAIIAARAKSYGMIVDLVTNGLLLRQREDVVQVIDSACFSLDGPPELMDSFLGEGTFAATLDAIAFCREKGLPARANSVLTNKTTVEDIGFLTELAREEKIEMNFCPPFEFVPIAEDPDFKALEIEDEHLRTLIREIIKRHDQGYPVQFTRRAFEWALRWPFPYSTTRVKRAELPADYQPPPCVHGEYVLFVDSDGRLYPCCNLWHDPQAPNLHDLGFTEAYRQVSRRGCDACYIFSYLDRNFIFNLRPTILVHYFFNLLQDVTKRMNTRKF